MRMHCCGSMGYRGAHSAACRFAGCLVAVGLSSLIAPVVGCRGPCRLERRLHKGQQFGVCECGAVRDVVGCCAGEFKHGGVDDSGETVPPDVLSAESVICIAASNGLDPGLSGFVAVWDPFRQGDRRWGVQVVQSEVCSDSGFASGRTDIWLVDDRTGEIVERAVESYTANVCLYGRESGAASGG